MTTPLTVVLPHLLAMSALSLLPVSAFAAGDTLTQKPFGKTADGTPVTLYTLTNANGVQAQITNYGGTLVSLRTPDRKGRLGDIVLGWDTLTGYLNGHTYFGALIGRYGNRIAKGKFTLEGTDYKLAVNNGPNSLHGGVRGFDKVVWKSTPLTKSVSGGVGIQLTYLSPDGEEGYPGNLTVKATWTLTDDNALKLEYTAQTDSATVINLTAHPYFNLNGAGNGTVLNHIVYLNADRYTPTDATAIPTGEISSVAGTPFDFRKPTAIGARIGANNQQIKFGSGYDHNFVLNHKEGDTEILAARVSSPTTGRILEVYTSEPGIQFYTGNFLNGKDIGHGGKAYPRRSAFCLEAQHYPDSPNHSDFPTTTLQPGDTYRSTTTYKFSTK